VTSRERPQRCGRTRGWQPPDERRRNTSNPTIGSRMQQACESFSGTNRRGREKRRGRHARHAAAGLHRVATPSAQRTLHDDVDEGDRSRTRSIERSTEAPTNPRRGSLRERTGADGPRRWRHPLVRERNEAHEGRTSESDIPTRKGRNERTEGGDRKGNLEDPAGRPARMHEERERQTTRYLMSPGQQRHPHRMELHRGP
jgi:hypothetical protein